MATNLTNGIFHEITKEGVSLVDFWAPWCGPCRMISPIIDQLSEEYAGKAKICKVNTDEETELAAKFGIRSIPTIVIMKDGQTVDTIMGATTKQALTKKLNEVLEG